MVWRGQICTLMAGGPDVAAATAAVVVVVVVVVVPLGPDTVMVVVTVAMVKDGYDRDREKCFHAERQGPRPTLTFHLSLDWVSFFSFFFTFFFPPSR